MKYVIYFFTCTFLLCLDYTAPTQSINDKKLVPGNTETLKAAIANQQDSLNEIFDKLEAKYSRRSKPKIVYVTKIVYVDSAAAGRRDSLYFQVVKKKLFQRIARNRKNDTILLATRPASLYAKPGN